MSELPKGEIVESRSVGQQFQKKKLIVFWVGNFQCYHVILRDFACIGLWIKVVKVQNWKTTREYFVPTNHEGKRGDKIQTSSLKIS